MHKLKYTFSYTEVENIIKYGQNKRFNKCPVRQYN